MSTVDVLVEVRSEQDDALERFAAASASMEVAHDQVRAILPSNVAGNLSYMETTKPIPMFVGPADGAAAPSSARSARSPRRSRAPTSPR